MGAVYAWAVIDLSHLGAGAFLASDGLIGFALFQALVQALLFSISDRLGPRMIVASGAWLAMAGAILVIAEPSIVTVAIGFCMIGAGFAANFSLSFDETAALAPGDGQGRAMARGTLAVYAGLVCAQPATGWIAQLVSLRLAWACVVGCAALIIALTPSAFKRHRPALADLRGGFIFLARSLAAMARSRRRR
jgi:predicted MFS family arabinose efflux permease